MRSLRVQTPEGAVVPAKALPMGEIEDTLLTQLNLGDMGPVLAVETAIAQAVLRNCSDLYFEPTRTHSRLRFRLDGVLHDVASLPLPSHERMVARLKVLARLPVYQKAAPQDGRIEPDPQWLDRGLRVSTLPTVDGEKVVVRIIDTERAPLELASLGLRPEAVAGLRGFIDRPQGTLLLTGPSSSGKTTTIYSLLRQIVAERSRAHILTVEDPVEYRLDGVCQTQVNANMGFDYATALRAILRQDPNVIVVGEIRDKTTAKTAIQAGLTGHLVLSTIHSGTAAGVFSRLLDMDIEPYLVTSSVNGVLAQRLVRKNCPDCSTPDDPAPELKARFGLDDAPVNFKKGAGCAACEGLGYSGRTAIAEVLFVNDEISDLILARERTRTIHAAAIKNGMTTLLQHGLEKVELGLTTLDELRMAVSPDEN